jgi:hypothetical protein
MARVVRAANWASKLPALESQGPIRREADAASTKLTKFPPMKVTDKRPLRHSTIGCTCAVLRKVEVTTAKVSTPLRLCVGGLPGQTRRHSLALPGSFRLRAALMFNRAST